MFSESAIRVEGLFKIFNTYDRPRDRLLQSLYGVGARVALSSGLRGRFARRSQECARKFWALHDVSFEIKRGDTVGIIGRNGSGKSTLLQIICGTLAPSGGDVTVNGRVAALLELGSGFNPEFTGRENVYLNGQLLGLTREQVSERFSEIIAFADIGDFIDQPVKTYSSGMFVRLAFAIAIHVDPEILIVDEALAVGDIQFQLKCIERMEEIRKSGTTILFVSHALEQIKRFCTTAIWLDKGRVRMAGEANFISDQYRDVMLMQSAEHAATPQGPRIDAANGAPAVIKLVSASATTLAPFDPLSVRIEYVVGDRALPKLLVGVAIRDAKGTYIFGPNTHLDKASIPYEPGTHIVEYIIPKVPLLTGTYVVDVGLFSDGGLVCIDYYGAASQVSVVAEYFSEGLVYIDHEWRVVNRG
ncbi:teichoic acid ABC transporter ATP-binding protein [Cupriavidus necator]|uniref:ABC transporter ATP-binding protein n=1 Tax=Cupriavidus necator TaxID=106590 RepID=UPI0007352FAE|nr:ABC transporter ATP-binding protein [Cupriavidus necator]KUE90275.1 teichoic acid ABC transporter ATP-binding protein [Cupriavidus necator]